MYFHLLIVTAIPSLFIAAKGRECFEEGVKWDSSYINGILSGVETAEECQQTCHINNLCTDFTWLWGNHTTFSRFCYHFGFPQEKVDSASSTSGPRACIDCSDTIACQEEQGNLVGHDDHIGYEEACQLKCGETPGCNFYTWYNGENSQKFRCNLFSSCNSVDSNCKGCFTGPPSCHPETTPSPSPSPSSPSPTTSPTVPTSSSAPVSDCSTPSDPRGGEWVCQDSPPERSEVSSCTVFCYPGYTASTNSQTDCLEGVWNPPLEGYYCIENTAVLLTGGDTLGTAVEVYMGRGRRGIEWPSLPTEKHRHTLDFIENQFVVCGGGSYMEEQQACIGLEMGGSWEQYPNLLHTREEHSSVVLGSLQIILGGESDAAIHSTEIKNYNLSEDWYPGFGLVVKTRGACAVRVSSDEIVVIGGYDSPNEVVMYNVMYLTHQKLPSLRVGRRNHGCAHMKTSDVDGVLVTGGFNDELMERLDNTEFYFLANRTWQQVGRLNVARSGLAVANIGDDVLALGGHNYASEMETLSSVERFKADTFTWVVEETEMTLPRSNPGAASFPLEFLKYKMTVDEKMEN